MSPSLSPTRLLLILLLLSGLLILPAGADDSTTGEEDTGSEEIQSDGDEDEREDGAPGEDDGDGGPPAHAGPPPSRGNALMDTGEARGHLAPAISQAGEQVTVHAVMQAFDHPGRNAGPPDGLPGGPASDGDRPGGPPAGVPGGPPEGVGPGFAQIDDELDGEATADDLDVTFTVDFGDGSPTEEMRPTKTRGADGTRRAIAHHVYEDEGAFTVTITAQPMDGEPAVIELVAQVGAGSARLDGDSRIDTAVAISQDAFPENGSAQAVLLARADEFADALAASTLAFVSDAPVLLTGSGDVPEIVLDEIDRVLAPGGPVFLLGGEAAISADVEQALVDEGLRVIRLSDDDRIGTALSIAAFVIESGMSPSQVVVASAGDFPDALAGAAYAAANGGIIVLTGTDALDDRVADLITGLSTSPEVVVVGGEAAISTGVFDALAQLGLPLMRVSGSSRYDTAAQLAELGYDGGDTVVLATGTNYPDALAGAVHAARLGAPVLLVDDTLPQPVADFLSRHADDLTSVITLGGSGAVPDEVIAAALALVNPAPTEDPEDAEGTEPDDVIQEGEADDGDDDSGDDGADGGDDADGDDGADGDDDADESDEA